MKLNKQLIWLANQVGITEMHRFRSDAMLAGAIFIRIDLIKTNQQPVTTVANQCHCRIYIHGIGVVYCTKPRGHWQTQQDKK